MSRKLGMRGHIRIIYANWVPLHNIYSYCLELIFRAVLDANTDTGKYIELATEYQLLTMMLNSRVNE